MASPLCGCGRAMSPDTSSTTENVWHCPTCDARRWDSKPKAKPSGAPIPAKVLRQFQREMKSAGALRGSGTWIKT